MTHGRRSRGFHPVRRRTKQWDAGPNAVGQAVSATGGTIWTSGVATSIEVTIARIRGYFTLNLESIAGVGEGFAGAIGMGLVSSASFAIGVTAVPTPVTEAGWDGWMLHQFFDVRAITATIADGANAASIVFRTDLDSKAMRKFQDDMTLMAVVEVTEIGTSVGRFQGDTRILTLLP